MGIFIVTKCSVCGKIKKCESMSKYFSNSEGCYICPKCKKEEEEKFKFTLIS